MKKTSAITLILILAISGVVLYRINYTKTVPVVEVPKTDPTPIVGENPEGEADPSRMKLDMNTWNWINTKYSDGKIVVPKDEAARRFTLTFKTDGSFSAKTDCNGVGGEYAVKGANIALTKMMSTLMYCEGSQEQEYTKMLGDVQDYRFTSRGELIFGLKGGTGSMIFR